MARIPFKSEYRPQIESGEYKVVTDCGEPVEVVKWNCKGEYSILAVIDDGDVEDTCFFNEAGISPHGTDSLYIITDEPELTEFQRLLGECVMEARCSIVDPLVHAVKWSDPLVEEIIKEVKKNWRSYFKPQDVTDIYNDGYKGGFIEGKIDALKDMPKWKNNWLGHTKKPCISKIYGYDNKQLCIDGKVIDIEDLWNKLPKEE